MHASSSALEAIETGRLILAAPDPVAPIIDDLADALRVALQEQVARFEAARADAIKGLDEQQTWRELEDDERDQILRDERLGDGAIVKVGTPQEIDATLGTTPLHDWPLRIMAVSSQAASALTRAAAIGTKAIPPVHLPHQAAVIRDQAELEEYLQKVRDTVSQHLADGKTVIV